MSSPNQQTRVSTENESYPVQGEDRVEREGLISHAVLAPSAFYQQEKTQTEPYSRTESSPTLGQIQPDMGASASSLLVQTSPVDNGPGEGAALVEPSVGERDRQRNNLRMRGIRQQLKDQKDRIKRLIPRRTGRALPSSELQLWTAAAEYIEYLQAENISLKEQAKIQAAAPILPKTLTGNTSTSFTGLPEMSYTPWDPVSSERYPNMSNNAGPSVSMPRNNNVFPTSAPTMTSTPNWSSFLASYNPGMVSSQVPVQSTSMEGMGVQWPPIAAASAQGNMNSQYFGSASDPVWDPVMLNHRNDYLAPWNETLGQCTPTDVHRIHTPNHGVGHTGAQFQTYGSTEGMSSNSANSGTQDYQFVFQQHPGHQGNHLFR